MTPYSIFEHFYLNVGDLKQFVYCPRIPYFNRFLNLKTSPTFLMEQGSAQEQEFDRKQKRHRPFRFGLREVSRHVHVNLVSDNYKLAGTADLVIEGQDEIVVIDCKGGEKRLSENHWIQVGAYALLAEEYYKKPCHKGFLYYAEGRQWTKVLIDERLKQKVTGLLGQMGKVIKEGIFPLPTGQVEKCRSCEFLNFCGDRW